MTNENQISMPQTSETKQKLHYDRIAEEYASHYDDPTSREFREKFFFNKMFHGIDFKQKKVLDAMCGLATTSDFLAKKGAETYGIDISDSFVRLYEKKFGKKFIIQGSVLDMPYDDDTFDMISISGGLHHLHPHVKSGMQEFIRVLKPQGTLVCIEPPANSLLDIIRKFWYKMDNNFADNEASIDIKKLSKDFDQNLILERVHYGGGPAYFIIFNSLILRLPIRLKKYIAPSLFFLERISDKLMSPLWASYIIFRFQKKE